MATSSESAPAAAERRESPRITIARAAADAAGSVPGVARLDPGAAGLQSTFSGRDRVAGVTVVADGAAYAVALSLVATPTDLHALSGEVERAVRRAVDASGVDAVLGSVHVTFTDLALPDETTTP